MPSAGRKQVNALVEEDEKYFWEEFCRQNDISMAQLIRKAVREYIDRRNG